MLTFGLTSQSSNNAQFATKSTKKVSRSYVGFDNIKLKLICSLCNEKLDHFIAANNFFPVLSNSLAYSESE